MGRIILDPFAASISTQGKDKHLHLPRRMYEKLETLGLLNGKFRFTIVAESLNPMTES